MNPYADALSAAVGPAVERWVRRSVDALLVAAAVDRTAAMADAIERAAVDARAHVAAELAEFLALDVDDQRTNPLAVLRSAVRFPTEVLRAAGVPDLVRDDFEVRAFPSDVYRLSPATWRDVDESLHEPGIIWGAWKAKTVLDRRRAEGKR